MASLGRTALRLRHLQRWRGLEARGLHSSMRRSAATNFAMPALSPTMTEGTIGTWKVKEGDSFSAGDVLLEIETDKAQMDVEAQDDGIVAKIFVDNGSKNVKVGTRIAVLAESDDDISSLEFPPDDSASAKESAPAKPAEPEPPKEQEAKPAPPSETPKPSPHRAPKTPFTPSPSVAHLLKEHGISDWSSIPASGPRGRLLKGDILAHLGKIQSGYPQELSSSVHKLEKLDLSNIKVKKTEAPKAVETKPAPAAKPEAPKEKNVTIPIRLDKVISGDITAISESSLPAIEASINKKVLLSDIALPAAKSSSQLFDELLGKPSKPVFKAAAGEFKPRLVLQTSTVSADVYDVLTGKASARAKPKKVLNGQPLLAVTIPANADPKRAQLFLKQAKNIVEAGVL